VICGLWPGLQCTVIRYAKSEMVLYVESNASYLSESKARSRYAGYHYISSASPPPPQPGQPPHPAPPLNGPINVPCKIMREILSSASEVKLAGLFYYGKEAAPEHITLEELGHPQPPTSIVTDNSTATGITNNTIQQKRSKSMDMRYYWIRDRVRQGHYQVTWRPGDTNLADYFTKHHPAKHHRRMRPRYLHEPHATTATYYECLDDEALQTVQQPFTNKMRSPSGEGVLIPYALAGPARRISFRPLFELSKAVGTVIAVTPMSNNGRAIHFLPSIARPHNLSSSPFTRQGAPSVQRPPGFHIFIYQCVWFNA
jgi:hypothetical protein